MMMTLDHILKIQENMRNYEETKKDRINLKRKFHIVNNCDLSLHRIAVKNYDNYDSLPGSYYSIARPSNLHSLRAKLGLPNIENKFKIRKI